MAASRYPVRRVRSGRFELGIVETSLALSVIVGLLFVTIRVMSGGMPGNWAQNQAMLAQAAQTVQAQAAQTSAIGTAVVKTEPSPLAPIEGETKNP